MSSKGEPGIEASSPKNSRPLSFGAIFSRKSNLVASAPNAPRRSISTRISGVSSREERQTPDRVTSVSPFRDVRASSTPESRALGSWSPPESPLVMNATFVPDGGAFDPDVGIIPLEEVGTTQQQSSSLARDDSFSYTHLEAQLLQGQKFFNGVSSENVGTVSDESLNKRISKFSFSPPDKTKLAQTHRENPNGGHTKAANQVPTYGPVPEFDTISTLAGLSSVSQSDDVGKDASRHNRKERYVALTEVKKLVAGKRSAKPKLLVSDPKRAESEGTPEIFVQAPVTPIVAHNHHEPKSPRAEKALRVPFLQKLRRNRVEDDPVPVNDGQINVAHGKQAVGSFFEDASSDGEDIEDDHESDDGHGDNRTFLGNARQASFRRPVLIEHRRSNSPQVGLTDILDRGPSPSQVRDVSPMSNEWLSMIEPALNTEQFGGKEKRQSGVIGWPTSEQQTEVPQTAKHANSAHQVGDGRPLAQATDVNFDSLRGSSSAPLENFVGSTSEGPKHLANGLRSHPTNAKQKPPKRQVTFPLTIQAKKGKYWEQGELISTPYPSGYIPKEASGDQHQRQNNQKANLTVVVYGRGQAAPQTDHVSVPTVAHEIPSKDPEKGGKIVMNRDFDDAALAHAIFGAYKSIRGAWYARLSARSVRSVRLLGYENTCQLATRQAKQQCFKVKEDTEGFAHTSLIELYQKPKKGKGRWLWWSWVRGLPENQEGAGRSGGKVALELIEGWTLKRILSALFLVAFFAVLATILWVVAGKSVAPVQITPPSYTITTASEPSETNATTTRSSFSSALPTSASSRTVYPDLSAPTGPPAASTALPPGVSGLGMGIPTLAVGGSVSTLSVVPRDSRVAPSSAPVESRGPTRTAMAASEQATQDAGGDGSVGSRLGPGVGLGVLILLVGWMVVGAWMAVSWMVI